MATTFREGQVIHHEGAAPPCPICGAAHSTCTATTGPITTTMTPARDAPASPDESADEAPPAPPAAEPLGDGTDDTPVSTGTYRGKRKR